MKSFFEFEAAAGLESTFRHHRVTPRSWSADEADAGLVATCRRHFLKLERSQVVGGRFKVEAGTGPTFGGQS